MDRRVQTMSDTRLIKKISRHLRAENLEDCENDDDLKKKAEQIIKIIRKHDKRHSPPLTCDICGKPATPPVFCEEHQP
jgi:predicted transposase YbfD/YdcC